MIRSDKEKYSRISICAGTGENKSMGMIAYERKKYTYLKVIHMYWGHIEQKQ